MIMLTATVTSVASAQQPYYGGGQYVDNNQYASDQFAGNQISGGTQFPDGGEFMGAGSVGSNEPLYYYDDQDRWKHGYIKIMPYYHGFHSFRPYNYHHVFGQSTTAQGFGMSPVMPYSQQFWHKYEHMADLSQGNHEPVYPGTEPIEENSHYPKPIQDADGPSAFIPRQQQISPTAQYQPVQYQNPAPQMRGPALPAPHRPY